MVIRCLRTGKVLEWCSGSAAECAAAMEKRIRDMAELCEWEPANIDAVVQKYRNTGNHPFMFDLGPAPAMTARQRRDAEAGRPIRG